MLQLAQQATLETRDRKHEPRTLAEQRTVWRAEAVETLGGPDRVDAMLHAGPEPAGRRRCRRSTAGVAGADGGPGDRGAGGASRDLAVLASVGRDPTPAPRRRDRPGRSPGRGRSRGGGGDRPLGPAHAGRRPGRVCRSELRRADGASVFTVAGSDQYTSTRILAAEQRLLDAAALTDGRALQPVAVDLGLAEAAAGGTALDAGQAQMVRTVATDRRRVQLVIAPAGAGKTTALKVLADTWTAGGGHILGLAPSAAAAAQLAEATGIPADTLHRLTWAIDHHHPLPDWADRIGPKTLLLIDEAGMADTLTLDTAVRHVLDRGGRVCLVGDDQQLGAIGAGGILTDLRRTLRGGPAHPAAPLHRPRRSRRHPPGPRRRPRGRRLLRRPGPDQDRRPRRSARPAPRRLAA